MFACDFLTSGFEVKAVPGMTRIVSQLSFCCRRFTKKNTYNDFNIYM